MTKNEFIQWFLGFVDAEGNFQTTKVKRVNKEGIISHYTLQYSFHLALHIRDKELLNYIQTMLNNIGTIYEYKDRYEIHLAVVKFEELKWLIDTIFEDVNSENKLLTVHQSTRLAQIIFGFKNHIKRIKNLEEFSKYVVEEIKPIVPPKSQEYWENWLIDFINGEASFTFVTKQIEKYLGFLLNIQMKELFIIFKNF